MIIQTVMILQFLIEIPVQIQAAHPC